MQGSLLGSLWRQQGFLLGLLQTQVSSPPIIQSATQEGISDSIALPAVTSMFRLCI